MNGRFVAVEVNLNACTTIVVFYKEEEEKSLK
jgi:hypothetical protein